jgi:hypothetical protein
MKNFILGTALFSIIQLVAVHYAKAADDGLKLIAGSVNPDGTSQIPTDRFTVARLGTGHYRITFAPNVFGKTLPLCLVMPVGVMTVGYIIGDVSFCDFVIVNTSPPGAPTDAIFGFMAAPVTQ